MKKPLLAIDIDDVIADSTEALRRVVNKRYDVDLAPQDYVLNDDGSYWGYYERVWAAHGLHHVRYDVLHDEMARDQSHVPLLPGASFAIGELTKRYDIMLITARDLAWEQVTLDWLTSHFGSVFTAVHFAGRTKHGVKVPSKGQLCKELGAKLLIDDNTEHCQSALDQGVDAILFGDYGWHNGKTDGLKVCKDWPAVLEYFDAQS